MRARSIFAILGLTALIVISVQIFAEPTSAITATVDFNPDTLSLKREGQWITAHIKLPDGNVQAIDVSTVKLGNIHADWGKVENDTLMVKFDSADVLDYVMVLLTHTGIISPGRRPLELTVTGELSDGSSFMATDTITILIPSGF